MRHAGLKPITQVEADLHRELPIATRDVGSKAHSCDAFVAPFTTKCCVRTNTRRPCSFADASALTVELRAPTQQRVAALVRQLDVERAPTEVMKLVTVKQAAATRCSTRYSACWRSPATRPAERKPTSRFAADSAALVGKSSLKTTAVPSARSRHVAPAQAARCVVRAMSAGVRCSVTIPSGTSQVVPVPGHTPSGPTWTR